MARRGIAGEAGPAAEVEGWRRRAQAVRAAALAAVFAAAPAASGPAAPAPVVVVPAVAAATAAGLLAMGSAVPAAAQTPRPFRHEQHQAMPCVACHGTGDRHGTVTLATPRDCAACHHDPGRAYACAACHRESDLPVARAVAATLSLTVWPEPRTRELPFRHDTHTALACQECHRAPVTLAANRECAACHAGHHRPAAECSACHGPPAPGVHPPAAHLTCAGSGCHAAEALERPVLSRTLCLVCHADQRDHEPGRECDACHMIPEPRATDVAGRGSDP